MRTAARLFYTCVLGLSVSAPPAVYAQMSLRDQLNDMQDNLDMLAAQAALRRADQELADCETRFAAGATDCVMPHFCAAAIAAAAAGDTVDCDGYQFTKR